jgi:hypothetical protein
MNTQNCSRQEFAREQSHELLNHFPSHVKGKKASIPVITICMQPGSGGHLIINARLF